MSISLSPAVVAECERLALPLEHLPAWWGALPAIRRADDVYQIFAADRRERLNVLCVKAEQSPADLTRRERAFYHGLLSEAVAVVALEFGA